MRDAYKVTRHINFTAKVKGPADTDRGTDELFFAEVTRDTKSGEHKLVVSCFCVINPDDNGIISLIITYILFKYSSLDTLT